MGRYDNFTDAQIAGVVGEIRRDFVVLTHELANLSHRIFRATLPAITSSRKFGPPLEVKRTIDAKTISGYGSIFNVPDHIRDVVMPGAFTETLAKHRRDGTPVVMLWSHNMDEPIGVWHRLEEDQKGLYVEGRLLPTVQRGAEAIELISAGATTGLSIGYRTLEAEDGENGIRRLLKLQLFEVSVVTLPMQPHARITGKEYSGEGPQAAVDELSRAVRSFIDAVKM